MKDAGYTHYTTVFRSRLGSALVAAGAATNRGLPRAALLRKIQTAVSATREVELANLSEVESRALVHLLDKKLVGSKERKKSRYRFSLEKTPAGNGSTKFRATIGGKPVQRVRVGAMDILLSDPRCRSTVGTPTPENSLELLDFSIQLGLVSSSRFKRTLAGEMARWLLTDSSPDANPFVIDQAAPLLLRQLIKADGIFLAHSLAQLTAAGASEFSRDDFVALLPAVVDLTIESLVAARTNRETVKEAKELKEAVRRGLSNKRKKAKELKEVGRRGLSNKRRSQGGPGVLEHRASARLEWLVDLGILEKAADRRNALRYKTTPLLEPSSQLLASSEHPHLEADELATRWWREANGLRPEAAEGDTSRFREALIDAYRVLQPSVGPTSVDDVCFLAALCAKWSTASRMKEELLRWGEAEKSIRFSGGRFQRHAARVYIEHSLVTGDRK